MDCGKTLAEYEKYLWEQELAEGTIRIYVRQAELFHEKTGGKPPTKKLLLTYKEGMEKQGYAETTINLHIIALNRYLKYLGRSDCTLKTLHIQRSRNLENVILMEEYRLLLETALRTGRIKYYYIMKTLASTGMRVSELAFLTVETLDSDRICVRNKGKTREIYLTAQLVNDLQSYCRIAGITYGFIFRGKQQTPITREAVYKMLQKIAADAGVSAKKVHPHSFRHMFAKTYMQRYGNLAELADILGHSSLETTRIYTTSTAEEKRSRMGDLGF